KLKWSETKRPTGQTLLSHPKPSQPEWSSCVRPSFSSASFPGGLVEHDIVIRIALPRFACPLWVVSGQNACRFRCPLYPQERTFAVQKEMSATGKRRWFAGRKYNGASDRLTRRTRLSLSTS